MIKSKNDILCRLTQFLLCLELFVFLLVSSAKFCNVGKNVSTMEALLNQSCTTNKSHVADSLVATEYAHNVQNKRTANSSSHLMQGVPAKNCFIFRHLSAEIFSSGFKKASVQTVFGCDYDNVCEGKEMNTIMFSVAFRGELGTLYCCDQNNCNGIGNMPHTPVENLICFSGTSNSSNVEKESCDLPNTKCVTKTEFLKDGKVESYFCDKEKSCDKQDSHGAYKFCQNTTVSNTTQQLCCCVRNACNVPSDWTLVKDTIHTAHSAASPTSTDAWKKIFHPITNPMTTTKSKSLVTGLVASIVVLALVGIGMLLYLAYKRRKSRDAGSRRDPNVIMQYERLSCSDASLEGSVGV